MEEEALPSLESWSGNVIPFSSDLAIVLIRRRKSPSVLSVSLTPILLLLISLFNRS